VEKSQKPFLRHRPVAVFFAGKRVRAMWRPNEQREFELVLGRAFDLAWDYLVGQPGLARTLDRDASRFIADAIVRHAEAGNRTEWALANCAIDEYRRRVGERVAA
jgi:hypothetical protein